MVVDAAARKSQRLRAKEAGDTGHPQGGPSELEKTLVSVLLPGPGCPPCPYPRKRSSEEEVGGNREKLAVWQLHPGRCGREEGGAQPRPLVTRCHLLLPRRRLAQTMAARWRGGPGQPQSLASADTYCPRPTLRLPKLGALDWGHSLARPSTTCSTSPPIISRACSRFSMRCWGHLLRFLLASLPLLQFQNLSLNAHYCLDYRMGCVWWGRDSHFTAGGKCLVPRALISQRIKIKFIFTVVRLTPFRKKKKILSSLQKSNHGIAAFSLHWAQILPLPPPKNLKIKV